MKNLITIANLTLVTAAAYTIWFLSAYFFLGTEKIHEQLITELPKSFFIRSTMPLILAALFSVLLWLANWLIVFYTKGSEWSYPLKIAGIAFVVCMSSGLIGVATFFWW